MSDFEEKQEMHTSELIRKLQVQVGHHLVET